MSLVGNLSFNYDRTSQSAGAPSHRSLAGASYGRLNPYIREVLGKDSSSILPSIEPSVSRQGGGHPSLNYDQENETSAQDEVEEVKQLARKLTRATTSERPPADPWHYEVGSALDPNSDNFRAKVFLKAMIDIQTGEHGRHLARTAGVSFRSLSCYGYGSGTDYLQTVGNTPMQIFGSIKTAFGGRKTRVEILRNFDGLVEAGEMLVVLGPPGSGCTTFLKTITGETHGFNVDKQSQINYKGISFEQMHQDFRGEAIYAAEQDVHFPQLTVGDTLYFAARARAPRNIPGHIAVEEYARHLRDVLMATFGIRHTVNTKVGNDFIRGVSGGERKRVSIAEACLNGSPLQAWDNSTRGLDSANAIEFCKTLRIATDLLNMTAAVAIYQAPQAAYDYFDKVLVLYEGRQLFFGKANEAKQYFIKMGWYCPERQTTADFLTSMTSTLERTASEGFETRVPRTPDEFAERWRSSPERGALLERIQAYEKEHPLGSKDLANFQQSMALQKSKRQRPKSPYTLSYLQQINLCLWRGFRSLAAEPSLTISQLLGNFMMALIVGSVFYNLDVTTNSFFSRGALIFFAILINAFGSALEILTLYAQRPIVEKHTRYALYHPSAEAFASMLIDLPYKTLNAIIFNVVLYFMTNLRREAGAFFFFLLISFFLTLVMSMLFRTIASVSRTLSQALAPAAVLILAIVIYTGFTIPTRTMLGWSRWINYLNPVAYGFESLMINEFHGRFYECAMLVPSGPGYGTGLDNKICTTVGSEPGKQQVSGDAFINESYEYYASHKWRNFGFIIAFMIALMLSYLAAAEYISAKKSKGEVLLFRRAQKPGALRDVIHNDPEAVPSGSSVPIEKRNENLGVPTVIERQTAIFQWHNVCYDIKIKDEDRRILDHVDGWVKPGTLTALMGVSGAGKTTLLDVLATRVTMGVISGEILVDGKQRDSSFQRKTGYVQQQDLHLATCTVREALNFSSILRQPAHIPRQEKLAYVDEVIKLLEMEEYADAVVGVPGEGLNVEQRKRLTIGVELAAKPQLLLFLDEPTSGLDSQTSWSILDLLEKLKSSGQAILCTIHQPSAILFQRFDRLLFLARGGRTVYFGPVGCGSKTLTSCFERNGALPCPPEANPAEWMLEIIGAAPGSHSEIDWPTVWRNSDEIKAVQRELEKMKTERSQMQTCVATRENKAQYHEFAAHFVIQLFEVQKRVFQQYWRTPAYIYAKMFLVTASGIFIGFSFFMAQNSIQGLQNQMFAIFMMMTIFGQLVQQIMPLFATQRALYEVRERPSKTYSWQAFLLSNLFAEVPWSTLCAVLLFCTWYYPVGLYRNCYPTDTVNERGALMFLFIWIFLVFTSTFAHLVISGVNTAETGGNIANLCFSVALIFCGVLATPTALPGFWIWMYRVSPFTYLIEGMLTTAVADTVVRCADYEYLHFPPPLGKTCVEYMESYISVAGGYLEQGSALSNNSCSYCILSDTNAFLKNLASNPQNMWRDWGIMWVYVIFNVCGTMVMYWLIRVPKPAKKDG